MTRHLATGLVFAAVISVSSLAAADVVFETVDAIETNSATTIRITGIIAGEAVPRTGVYYVATAGSDSLLRCDRLALLAMSTPGKFQFTLVGVSTYSCKLAVRAP